MSQYLSQFAKVAAVLYTASSTTEGSYYGALSQLLAGALRERRLPFDVRILPSERRSTGGRDLPDMALYDGSESFPVVCCEVKTPSSGDVSGIAQSTDRNDQIGRYLALTGAVIVSNVWSFALVVAEEGTPRNRPVPPEQRKMFGPVYLWNSAEKIAVEPISKRGYERLIDLVESAVTRYAPIAEPQSLAKVLANQARQAKLALPDSFGKSVSALLTDFGSALGVTFEGEEGEQFFRSSLIQTAFYGLFAGWVLSLKDGTQNQFHWSQIADTLRIPFLGGLFHEFQHPVRLREIGLRPFLDQANQTLRRVDRQAFLEKFTKTDPSRGPIFASVAQDAITYFYEPFLEAFDPAVRQELGVWYTPPQIVKYQVRKIDHLLRTQLGKKRGFADPDVVVLDPCCGTGAYLLEVIACMNEQLQLEGVGDLAGEMLLDALQNRIFGFEILTAPFVIAHLQIYLALAGLGVEPRSNQRPAVYLTNALTGWDGNSRTGAHFPELQQEHDAAQVVKTNSRIIVILGNPPYRRFVGVPVQEDMRLVDYYKGIRRAPNGKQIGKSQLFNEWGIKKHALNDLYLRFFRVAEQCIGERATFGIVSFISNSSFLKGRSHPIMRESLLKNFDTIWVDNLHGHRLANERTPWGESCETVFNMEGIGTGIKVGTAITTLVKCEAANSDNAELYIRDFWGRAAAKREALLESLRVDTADPSRKHSGAELPQRAISYEKHVPTKSSNWKLIKGDELCSYDDWVALDDLFSMKFQGINPNRGLSGSVIDENRDSLRNRMIDYFSDLSDEAVRSRYQELMTDRARYIASRTRAFLKGKSAFKESLLVPYVLFPLDLRWIYYETSGKFLNECRPELFANLDRNEFLIVVPEPRRPSESIPLFTTRSFDLHLHDRGSIGFPAEVISSDSLFQNNDTGEALRAANLKAPVWKRMCEEWETPGDLKSEAARKHSRLLLRVCLAIGHSTQYQMDNRDYLQEDIARIPIPKDLALFSEIAALGDQVASLVDPERDVDELLKKLLGRPESMAVLTQLDGKAIRRENLVVSYSYYGSARGRIEPCSTESTDGDWNTEEDMLDLFLNPQVVFRNVPRAAWQMELGGYQVLKKWLGYRDAKRRNGTPLSLVEVSYFRSLVLRLAALCAMRPLLDRAYEMASQRCFTLGDFT